MNSKEINLSVLMYKHVSGKGWIEAIGRLHPKTGGIELHFEKCEERGHIDSLVIQSKADITRFLKVISLEGKATKNQVRELLISELA